MVRDEIQSKPTTNLAPSNWANVLNFSEDSCLTTSGLVDKTASLDDIASSDIVRGILANIGWKWII